MEKIRLATSDMRHKIYADAKKIIRESGFAFAIHRAAQGWKVTETKTGMAVFTGAKYNEALHALDETLLEKVKAAFGRPHVMGQLKKCPNLNPHIS